MLRKYVHPEPEGTYKLRKEQGRDVNLQSQRCEVYALCHRIVVIHLKKIKIINVYKKCAQRVIIFQT